MVLDAGTPHERSLQARRGIHLTAVDSRGLGPTLNDAAHVSRTGGVLTEIVDPRVTDAVRARLGPVYRELLDVMVDLAVPGAGHYSATWPQSRDLRYR